METLQLIAIVIGIILFLTFLFLIWRKKKKRKKTEGAHALSKKNEDVSIDSESHESNAITTQKVGSEGVVEKDDGDANSLSG